MTVGASTPEGSRLRPPGAVVDIARTLQQAGHAAWCVGGAVRDALLGVENLDWDLATSALLLLCALVLRSAVDWFCC